MISMLARPRADQQEYARQIFLFSIPIDEDLQEEMTEEAGTEMIMRSCKYVWVWFCGMSSSLYCMKRIDDESFCRAGRQFLVRFTSESASALTS